MKRYWVAAFASALMPLAAHAQWAITDVFNFTNAETNGNLYAPSSLTAGSDGNIYGVTYQGGTDNRGTVYKLSLTWSAGVPSGSYTALHEFTDGSDGGNPIGSMVQDANGNFYGTTSGGGANGDGVVFEYSAAGVYSVIHNFAGGTTDGCDPTGLTLGSSGSTVVLYGATYACGSSANDGVVYKLTGSSGGAWSESILHAFAGGTADGYGPNSVILASDGNLYGTTTYGGAHSEGTVFRIVPSSHVETLIFSFIYPDSPNGSSVTQLSGASSFTLFGTSPSGGSPGYGAVYSLTEGSGGKFTFSIVHNFQAGTSDGAYPYGNLIYSSTLGYFFGTTAEGGTSNGGTFYSISPAGVIGVLNSLAGGSNEGPVWAESSNCSPCVFGTTKGGGTGYGTAWVGIAP